MDTIIDVTYIHNTISSIGQWNDTLADHEALVNDAIATISSAGRRVVRVETAYIGTIYPMRIITELHIAEGEMRKRCPD